MPDFRDRFKLRTERGSITVTIELSVLPDAPLRSAIDPRNTVSGGYRLSIVGSGPVGGGQCVDTLREVGAGMPAIAKLADAWDRWHLNDPHAVTHMVTLLRSDLTDEQIAADYGCLSRGDPLRQIDLARAVVSECRRREAALGIILNDRGKPMFLLDRAKRTACMSFGWTAAGEVIGKTSDDRMFASWNDCWTAIAGKG